MKHTLLLTTLSCLSLGCTSLQGRAPDADAASDAGDAVVDRPDARGGALLGAVDTTLRWAWPIGVTAGAVRRDAAGRLLLSAGVADGLERDLAIAHLTPSGGAGALPGADAAGFVRVQARQGMGRLASVPRAMVLDRQGRVVVAGSGLVAGRRYGLVARWLADGALDAGFGTGGFVVIEAPTGAPARDVVLRAVVAEDDGAIVVAGGDALPLNRSTVGVYARLLADGAIDRSFGGVTVDARFAAFSALVRDGSGYALAGDGTVASAPMVLYVGADGRAMAGVGDGGAVTHEAAMAGPMVVRAMVRDVDGGLVVAGGAGAQVWNSTPLHLVRFSSQRQPDLAWGEAGVLRAFTSATWNYEMAHAGALIPWTAGSVLVMGQQAFGYRIYRVLRDGRVDVGFGDGPLGAQPTGFQYAFEMLPDERGGLWVYSRAGMELEVVGTHHPPLP
jgi:hypothetical protein